MIATAEITVSVIKVSLVLSLIKSFVFNSALGKLIQMIGIIQIALHIPLMNVQVPSNAIEFYSIVVPVVNYDLLSSIP